MSDKKLEPAHVGSEQVQDLQAIIVSVLKHWSRYDDQYEAIFKDTDFCSSCWRHKTRCAVDCDCAACKKK